MIHCTLYADKIPTIKDQLTTYLSESIGRPFLFGSFDCALFAAGWVDWLTGSNLLEEHREKYTTVDQATRRFQSDNWMMYALKRFKEAGLRKTNCPEIGDVAFCPECIGLVTELAGTLAIASPAEKTRWYVLRPIDEGKIFMHKP